MLEDQVISESNTVIVDTFMVSPQRNKSDDLSDKVANLTIKSRNENYLINKVAKMIINAINENDLINKVANMTINDVRKNLN